MRTDEVGDELLIQTVLAIDAVEDALEFLELLERRLPHEFENPVAGVLRRHFQSAADVSAY